MIRSLPGIMTSSGPGRCFPCTRDPVQLFLAQSADIVMAADYDGFPDYYKEPWFPPVYPRSWLHPPVLACELRKPAS